MLIVYQGMTEMFVVTKENEEKFLRVYFSEGGRDIDDFDREIFNDAVKISSRIVSKVVW
jgi:hypothetical protein